MIFKVALLIAVSAVVSAQYGHHYPAHGYGHGYEGPHDYHAPQPYDYGYDVKDDYGNKQFRKETGDGKGAVKGSYGYVDAHGIHRQVDYVADHHGFRAQVKTNEPGTANQNPAAVGVHSAAPVHVHAPAYAAPSHYAPVHHAGPHYAPSYHIPYRVPKYAYY
ncbi:cuticle protein 10.9-like [Argiope bruennichi]|uniref:Adult-specific rigid cuticular protein 15.5 like protein n=1 Tax=Argiope bruennichi TaxID=94029 RepID=A0A8T0E638_ARGBR|nr:cuticle protein 10.9-like [Argiope bruennichi]KAF8767253.1 Adult-specific rigid cuticular protein 15.5 like protein [Argiope bruennichi]